ncbi:MAG TPA: FkbM family methyltransferase [Terracidiphilus sp.]|nr:FkbM family methyltransferase [Terracidiphilus sp.]
MPTVLEESCAEAIKTLETQIARCETPRLWNDWATLQYGRGHVSEAERGFRRSLELEASNRPAAVNLGLLLFAQGRLQEAMPFLEQHKNTLTDKERQAILEMTTRLQSEAATQPPASPVSANKRSSYTVSASEFPRFAEISTKYFVEINSEEPAASAAAHLNGWQGLSVGNYANHPGQSPRVKLVEESISADSAVSILRRHEIPSEFDLLTIHGAFNGFHLLRAVLTGFRPRVVSVQYNASLGKEADKVVPYLRSAQWDGTDYFGASFQAFCRLADFFGYVPVFCDSDGTTLVLTRKDCLQAAEKPHAEQVFRSGPQYPADQKRRPYLTSQHYLLNGLSVFSSQYGYISYFANDEYIGRQLANGAYWDAALLEQIGPMLSSLSGLALDIGAHIGSHSIAMARYAPGLKFVCFEPQLPLFRLLERNIHENGLADRILPVWGAAGHTSGKTTLSRNASDGTSAGQSFSYGNGAPVNLGGIQIGVGGQECPLIRIDDVEQIRKSSVAYVKMDVEGAEPLVIQGMENTLKTNRPVFLYEERQDRQLAAETLDALHVAPGQIFSVTAFLQARGYQIHTVALDCLAIPGPLKKIEPQHQTDASSIPARIFQTWKTKKALPAPYDVWSQTFKSQNPDFTWELWDDNDNRNFIQTKFPWFLKTYDSYRAEIYRADVVRYFYLYTFGGIYADLDTECLRPLSPLLNRADVILGRMGPSEAFAHSIPNAIMASKPKQEFWLLVISLLLQFSQNDARPELLTGPVLLKSAFDLYTAKDPLWVRLAIDSIRARLSPEQQPLQGPSKIELLSSRQWFPIDWSDPIHQLLRTNVLTGKLLDDAAKAALFPEAWMVTYWSHSWEKSPHNPKADA